MRSFLKKCVFLLFTAIPVFSQSGGSSPQQGLFSGGPFWRQALGGTVLSLPDVQVQSAVVALDGGNIRAYSASGTPMWDYSARGRISPYVTRSREGTSYFSRTNGILIAVNRVGRELWRHNLENPLSAKVVVGWDSRLFVPTEKKISCYTASGNLLWTRTFESPFSLAPKLDRSGGIILALEKEVFRIDQFGNTSRWTLSKNPVVLLSFDRQRILSLYTDGTMEILGVSEDWFVSAEIETYSSRLPELPAVPLAAVSSGDNFAATLNDGRVVLVSLDERKIIWSGDSHIREIINNGTMPELEVEMLYDERGIYILSKNGATGFSHDGRRLWYMFLQNVAAVPAFGNDGVLYAGGRDWILYAYKIEDRILPERLSLYGPAADGVYGTGSPQASSLAGFPLNEYELRIKLEQAASAINYGRVGANELEWTSMLMMVSTSQFGIQYRVNALQLLGKIGSHETIPWLSGFFYRETDTTLKSAAAAAIGAIGVDPQGIAIRTFYDSITHLGGIRDEQVLTAIASATGALCRFSGPPLSETGVRILTLLSTDNQPQIVSNRAKRELASLR